jgi:tetratricopeptide (TPR) repeat protein
MKPPRYSGANNERTCEMKATILVFLGLSILAGAVVYLTRPQGAPVPSAAPVAEPASAASSETPKTAEAMLAGPGRLEAPSAQPALARPQGAPARSASKPGSDTTMLQQAIDLLASPQAAYGQKQATWKQLRDAGKLDQAISVLEQRMAAEPRAPEYPAALGQAYLKKCATLQDVREQGILGMQADKLFDAALELDPSNWEARFTKAVALCHWPAGMNKGLEAIQHFRTLIQQQEGQPAEPHFAESYVWLGNQYQASGQSEYARMVWERGAGFFPHNEALQGKLAASTALNSDPTGGQ